MIFQKIIKLYSEKTTTTTKPYPTKWSRLYSEKRREKIDVREKVR